MAPAGNVLTPEVFFGESLIGLQIFEAIQRTVDAIGESTIRVTKSQIAFRRRKGFAYVWRPGQYVKNDAPAVLSIALGREVTSDRIKSVAHPHPTVWMHHLELRDPGEVDEDVRELLCEAHRRA